jgi:hypothetical protein
MESTEQMALGSLTRLFIEPPAHVMLSRCCIFAFAACCLSKIAYMVVIEELLAASENVS